MSRLRLDELPGDRPVAIMVRHAERHAIAAGSVGVDVGLTEEGREAALRFGAALGARLRSITTSPIARCRATAALLGEGAGCPHQLVDDSRLGGPGAFVADGDVAWANWQRLGNEGVIAHLMSSDEVLPGMHPPAVASERLLELLSAALEREIGVHVFVTHDAILAPFIARLFGRPLVREEWPGYLDGLLLCRRGSVPDSDLLASISGAPPWSSWRAASPSLRARA